jgi:hypothetical protein
MVTGSARGESNAARFTYTQCETRGVGRDIYSPVCEDYPPNSQRLVRKIDWVLLDIGTDSQDHCSTQPDLHLRRFGTNDKPPLAAASSSGGQAECLGECQGQLYLVLP